DLRIDGEPIAVGAVRVPPGAHELRVGYTLLSWQRESESRFRSQLVGYEPAPSAWRADDFRAFNALPPGDYALRIEGRDYAGNVSAPIELAVTIVPAWWQESSARAAFAGAALLVLAGVLRWRTRSMTVQRHRLEEQVADRTAELNAANARL